MGVGGTARYFVDCTSEEAIRQALVYARDHDLHTHILGGGSNTLVADEGFDGLVIKISLPGISFDRTGSRVLALAGAGEDWDRFVQQTVNRGLGGIECLSGIPGLVGATPVQNVGAYGQEVRTTISGVRAIDRSTLETLTLQPDDCRFGYRTSRFKTEDAGRYVITRITFALMQDALPIVRYPELSEELTKSNDISSLPAGRESLTAVREAVLRIRRRKSMVIDPADPNTKSVGSFFVNPVLSPKEFDALNDRARALGTRLPVAHFPAGSEIKVSAAWLVEQAGFSKGYRRGKAGISEHHSLALVNHGGTTREILDLASAIEASVLEKFGVRLQREPVFLR
jgi:UDP-N-acetylmuramate dehydrogenase